MKYLILALMIVSVPALATKTAAGTRFTVSCERVAASASNAVYAYLTMGTTDDEELTQRCEKSDHVLTATEATNLAAICTSLSGEIKTAESIP